MNKTDLTLEFETSSDLDTFLKRSGRTGVEAMLNEATTYYKFGLKPDIQLIAIDQKNGTYKELSSDLYRLGVQTRTYSIALDAFRAHALKKQAGVETVGKLITRILALYDEILTARESGLKICFQNLQSGDVKEIKIQKHEPSTPTLL